MNARTILSILLAIACLIVAPRAAAESSAALVSDRVMVHGIVPPAWVERQGRIIALRPETYLLEGDQIRTGPGGRVEVDLPDGSAFKLGAVTQLAMTQARMTRVAEADVFGSALHLLKGAFRFTTHAFGKARKRDVRVQVGTVTIGIRGTDLMITSGDEGDHIMLVEGRIEIAGAGMAAPMIMEQPMDLMMFNKDGLMSHPALAPAAMMGEMHAMEAMMAMPEGRGMLMMGMAPMYDVVVMSFLDQRRAERAAARLQQDGWPVEIADGAAFGQTWHRVAVHGFPSKAEALGFRERIEGEHGISGAWLKRH